jgi:curved DNA-binding protein CbpA
MNIKECFDILELKIDATLDQVKKAYKKLMMLCHPDKVHKDPDLKMIAERRAKEINVAREELVAYLSERKSG